MIPFEFVFSLRILNLSVLSSFRQMHPQKELFQSNTFPGWEPQPTLQLKRSIVVESNALNACWFWPDTVRDQITPFDRSSDSVYPDFRQGHPHLAASWREQGPFLGRWQSCVKFACQLKPTRHRLRSSVQLRSSRPGELYCKGHHVCRQEQPASAGQFRELESEVGYLLNACNNKMASDWGLPSIKSPITYVHVIVPEALR